MKRKKPAGKGGHTRYRVITVYGHGTVEVRKTKIKLRKALKARKLNGLKPGAEKREIPIICSTEHFAQDQNQRFGASERFFGMQNEQ